MFLLNMLNICYFTSEVDNIHISWVANEWNIIIVHFISEIKDLFNKKHLNFLLLSTNFP